jgi:hypothetical protein
MMGGIRLKVSRATLAASFSLGDFSGVSAVSSCRLSGYPWKARRGAQLIFL